MVTGLGNNKVSGALTKKLIFRGATVVAGGKDETTAETLMNEVKTKKNWGQTEGSLEFIPLDQSSIKSCKDFVTKFEEKALPLHHLSLLPGSSLSLFLSLRLE